MIMERKKGNPTPERSGKVRCYPGLVEAETGNEGKEPVVKKEQARGGT